MYTDIKQATFTAIYANVKKRQCSWCILHIISTNVLWIRNCRHALGRLAGSRRTLLYMQQRWAGGYHGCQKVCHHKRM